MSEFECTLYYPTGQGAMEDPAPRNADGLTEKGAKLLDDMLSYIATLEAHGTTVRYEMVGQNVFARAHEMFPATFAPKPEAETGLSDEQEDALAAAVVTLELADNRGKKAIQLLKSAFPEVFEEEGDDIGPEMTRREFVATEVGGDPNVKHHLIVHCGAPDAKTPSASRSG